MSREAMTAARNTVVALTLALTACSSPDFSAGHEHPRSPTIRQNPITGRWEQIWKGDYCNAGDCGDGGVQDGVKTKTDRLGLGVPRRGAIGWTCNYTYWPTKLEPFGGGQEHCLVPMKPENLRSGVAHTTADDEPGATSNFHRFIWPERRSNPGAPEYMGMLAFVKCRPAAGIQ